VKHNNLLSKVHLRVGTVMHVEDFPEADKPMYKLRIDFGPKLGIKEACSQITNYPKETLLNMQILCMTQVPAMRIGSFTSEVIVCGCYHQNGSVILMIPAAEIPNGYSLST